MKAKLVSGMRLQTENLMRSRLQAVSRPNVPASRSGPTQIVPPRRTRIQLARGLQQLAEGAGAAWRWLCVKRMEQQSSKRLRVVETVSLGEKRFVAMLHVDGAQFLIGGGANSVSLLASLEAGERPHPFADVLRQQAERETEQNR